MRTATVSTFSFSRIRGIKRYEMSNHLGNVMVVVSDRKVVQTNGSYLADLVSTTDYYAFGMVMSDRSWNTEGYRFGFNGQEKSPEIAEGHTTALYWEYDSRLGRRWNLDPVATAFESEYAVNGNNPIYYVDPNGDFKTKFGAKIYNFFHGGKGEVKQAGIGDKKHAGEWYVGKSVEHKDKIGGVTYQRKFSSDNEADNIADKGIDIGEKAIDVAKNSEYVVEGKVKVSAGAQIGIKGTWFGLEGKAEAGLLTFDLYEAKYDFIKMKGSHGRSEKRIHNFIGFSGTLFSEKLSIGGKYDYTFLYDINYYGGIGMVKDSDTHDWTVNLPLKSFGPKINLSPRIDARLKVNRTAQVANNKQFYGIDVGAGVKFIFGVDIKLKLGLKL